MTTKLNGTLKRELAIDGEAYTLTLSESGFTLTLKGRRKGLDIRWADLVGGDAALATALNASLTANIAPRGKPPERVTKEAKPTQPTNRAKRGSAANDPSAGRPVTGSPADRRKPRPASPKTKARRTSDPRTSSRRGR